MIRNDIKSISQLDFFVEQSLKAIETELFSAFGFYTTTNRKYISIRKTFYHNEYVIDLYFNCRLFGVYKFNNDYDLKRIIRDIKYLLIKYGWDSTYTHFKKGGK